MPPPGGLRTSLSFTMQTQGSGPMSAAFQPSSGAFSPGLPLIPVQPQPTRSFDFGVGQNTLLQPRAGYEHIHSFASLRAFANVELVRLAIETCKDQVERLDWKVKPRDGKKGGKTSSDARIKECERFFRRPDGVTPFATWLRSLLEDLLVLDAPAIEKRRDRGGKLIGLDVIAGDTIKLLVDETGRRPRAPVPAFQQVIKGTPWNLLTTDDLIYAPRNPRPNHLYGLSPVEQIIVTVNTILRRQAVQLGYFTEGNQPAGILNVPAGWGPDAIRTMQDVWDARMEGDLPAKSKLQWVPEGTKYQAFKESPLKDEFDEWLARVVCFTFSLPPTAFVKQMNRAASEQQANTADEEGVASRKLWWARIANTVIQEDFGFDDLEWGWNDGAEVNPQVQATIDDLNLRNGSATLDEVRDGRGLDTLPDGAGQQAMVYLPTGPVLVTKVVEEALNPPEPPPPPPVLMVHPPTDEAPKPPEAPGSEEQAEQPHPSKVAPRGDASKLAKAAAQRPAVKRAQAAAAKAIAKALKATGRSVAAEVEGRLGKRTAEAAEDVLSKGPADDSSVGRSLAAQLAEQVRLDDLEALDISDQLFSAAYDSAEQGLAKLGVDSTDALTNQIDAKAVAYAQRRAAELVSVKGDENIVATTRAMIRGVIAKGLEDNVGGPKIADAIREAAAFSEARAETIAKTEIRKANTQGTLDGGRVAKSEDGLTVDKRWLIATAGCCDVCQGNADAGWIEIDEDFPSGDDGTPGHPNCNCDVAMRASQPDDGDGFDSQDDED